MMLHPHGVAVFIEVPKTGSTACTLHLRDAGGWFQNGSKGTKQVPGTSFPGRHALLSQETRDVFDDLGVTAYGVVRNPWDRMASLWRASAPGSTSFISYLKTGRFTHGHIDIMTTPQHEWLRWVDHVIHYENLAREWDQMSYQFGHLPLGPIPPRNVSKSRAIPPWTAEEIAIVAERFAIDAEVYGYGGPS